MKAIICEKYGLPDTLIYRETTLNPPGPRQVRIGIKACSVNFPDTLIIQGLYQVKPPLPFTPGSDIAGVVLETGAEVSEFEVGDEVFGFVMTGGFAEEVIAEAGQIFTKPSGMSFPVAASFLMAYGTSYHALKDRAQIQPGETLVVLGASGGVGLAAVALGKLLGARVIAAASSAEKLTLCQEHGADEIINYQKEDLKNRIKKLTNGKGADVIYDPVGGDYSEAALRAMGWNGRFLVVGFATGEIPKISLNLALLKSCQIVGVFWGAFAMRFPKENIKNSQLLLQWLLSGNLNPHIHATYPLADTPKALNEMMARKVKGKVVITV